MWAGRVPGSTFAPVGPHPRRSPAPWTRVLNEPRFRERAGALQAETNGTSPAAAAADLLEGLAVKGSGPVLQSHPMRH